MFVPTKVTPTPTSTMTAPPMFARGQRCASTMRGAHPRRRSTRETMMISRTDSLGTTPTTKRRRAGARASAAAEDERGGRRMKATELKRALVDAGVDVSDCFERADLEAKYALLTEEQKAGKSSTSAKSEEPKRERASARATSSTTETSSSSSSSKTMFTNAQRFFKESLENLKSKLRLDSVWAAVREKANRVNATSGAGTKAQSVLEDVRRKVKETDSKLGVTKWFKTNVPKVLDEYAKARQTPVGRFLNFMFWIWLFTSGVFWSLLYFGLTATFLVNLLMPNLIAEQVENMQRKAAEQMNASGMGGMGGAGFDPRMGGMGGMGGGAGYDPRMSGMGERGGGGRKSYGGGGSPGDTIDVDAQVSDRD